MQLHVTICPAFTDHLFYQSCLYLLLDVSEYQVGYDEVGIVLEGQLVVGVLFCCDTQGGSFGRQVMDIWSLLLTQCSFLLDHSNEGNHAGGVRLMQLQINTVVFAI